MASQLLERSERIHRRSSIVSSARLIPSVSMTSFPGKWKKNECNQGKTHERLSPRTPKTENENGKEEKKKETPKNRRNPGHTGGGRRGLFIVTVAKASPTRSVCFPPVSIRWNLSPLEQNFFFSAFRLPWWHTQSARVAHRRPTPPPPPPPPPPT